MKPSSTGRWLGCAAALLGAALAGAAWPMQTTPGPAEWKADFERAGSEADWAVAGKIEAERLSLAAVAPAEAKSAPAGHAVRLRAEAGSVFATRAGVLPPSCLPYTAVELKVWRPAGAGDAVMDVIAYEAPPHCYFVKRLELKETGWRTTTLPLRWFRPGPAAVPRWSHVTRLAFTFRSAGEYWVDDVRLVPGPAPRAAEASLEDIGRLAFPGAEPHRLKRVDRPHLRLLSDAAELDAEKLSGHLERTHAAFFRKLPFVEKPESPPWLLVFATAEGYRGFAPRLAERFDARAARPSSSGYTLLGFAHSAWDPRRGDLRSVYTHEYIHSLLERSARVPNRPDWVQEGLATLFQAEFHPEFNLAEQTRSRWPQAKPLADLCSGNALRPEDYWQAATVWGCLLEHPRRKAKLSDLMEALRRSETADLAPHLKPIFGESWPELTAAWRLYCRTTFGVP